MASSVNIVLINPYELGRQPFGLAEPAAWLNEAGHHVRCLDLSLQSLDSDILRETTLIGIYVGMHAVWCGACGVWCGVACDTEYLLYATHTTATPHHTT